MGRVKEKAIDEISRINLNDLKPSKEELEVKMVMYAKRFKPLRDLLKWVWEHRDKEIISQELAEGLKIRKIYALDKLNYLATLGLLRKFGSRPKIFVVNDISMLERIIKELP